MSTINARAMNFVLKIANRESNANFFRDILGMKVLRHDEFNEGCEVSVLEPSTTRWSKTMVGYGPEWDYFAIELTWNLLTNNYKLGNGFMGITISSTESIARAKALKWEIVQKDGVNVVHSPDGYLFYILDMPEEKSKDPLIKVTLASTDIERTVNYWNGILGMKILYYDENEVLFTFGEGQACLEFKKIDEHINHGTSFGRITFGVPMSDLRNIETKIVDNKWKVLTHIVDLDAPGKATVTVLIIADPDDHEICFVGEENFKLLSKFDHDANALLDFHLRRCKLKYSL